MMPILNPHKVSFVPIFNIMDKKERDVKATLDNLRLQQKQKGDLVLEILNRL